MRIFRELAAKLDFLQLRPRGVDGVAVRPVLEEGHRRYILKTIHRKTFIKLSEAEYVMWQKMNGTRSVRELHTAFYEQFHVLPGDHLVDLILRLRDRYFLTDADVAVFASLSLALARRRGLAALIRALSTEFHLPRADALMGWLYRYGAWLGFTRTGGLVLALVGVGGGYGLWRMVTDGTYSPWHLGGSVALAFLGYATAAVLVTGTHEVAHALAVKHYGREVIGIRCVIWAGAFPLTSVDTTDMHMEPSRRAKVVVSLAGPASHVVIGGFAVIAAFLLSPGFGGHMLFLLALYAYGFLMLPALYPGTNSDWYNIVSDAGGVPQLRAKVDRFLQRDFWGKLWGRQPFTREEWILVFYAVLLRAWWIAFLLAATWLAIRGRWIVRELWAGGGWLGVVILLAGALIGTALATLVLVGVSRRAIRVMKRLGWLARPLALVRGSFAVVAAGVAMLVVGLTVAGRPAWAWDAMALAAAVACATLVGLAAYGRTQWSDHFWHSVQVWLQAAAILLTGRLVVAVWPGSMALHGWPIGLELAAAAAVLGGAVRAHRINGFDACTRRERHVLLGCGLPIAVALGIGAVTVFFLGASGPYAGARLASATILVTALCLLMPTVLTFGGTVGAGVWNATLGAVGTLAAGTLLDPLVRGRESDVNGPIPLVSGAFYVVILCYAAAFQLVAFRRMRFARPRLADAASPDDRRTIGTTLGALLAHAVENTARLLGARAAARLEEAFNRVSANEDLAFRLREGRLQRGIPDDAEMAEVLRIARGALGTMNRLVSRIAGTRFARDLMAHGVGSVSWAGRETLTNWLGPDGTPWRREAGEPADASPAGLAVLVRGVPFLQSLPDEALARVASLLSIRECRAGETLFSTGDPGEHFYMVLAGKIEVVREAWTGAERILGTVGPGDYFGEVALFEDVPRTAGARASHATRLAVLSGRHFRQHVMPHVPCEAHGSWNLIHMLRRLPLFREFEWPRLVEIARRFRVAQVGADVVLIREGEPGNAFYVVGSGRVEVKVGPTPGDSQGMALAVLGPGECFGELALLYDRPRSAMVRTLATCELFVLARTDFEAFQAQMCRPDGPGLQLASRRAYNLTPRKRAELEPSRFLEDRAGPVAAGSPRS